MKSLKEQIEVMEYFLNGGEVEYRTLDSDWKIASTPLWDWLRCDYRIKKPKVTVTIEKWLCENLTIEDNTEFWTCETSNIDSYIENINARKIKLIDTYEVEI